MTRGWHLVTVVALLATSLAGAFVVFGRLQSFAEILSSWWSAGGAVAGFAIIYELLRRTLKSYQRGVMTVSLLRLYENHVVHEMTKALMQLLEFVGDGDGLAIPDFIDLDDLKESARSLRHRARHHILCFATPLGDLQRYYYTMCMSLNLKQTLRKL